MKYPETEYNDSPVTPEDVRKVDEFCERKTTATLAIVFTDVVDSTAIRERLGELQYEAVREAHEADVSRIVTADDSGVIVKGTGDGVLAVFAEPSTAVERCLRLQELMARHPYFRLRIGIDMGQVSTKSRGGVVADVFGRHVNRAARIEAKAQPDQLLVSFTVYDCAVGWLHDRVNWRHLGPTDLKGFAAPVSIHEPYPARHGVFHGSEPGARSGGQRPPIGPSLALENLVWTVEQLADTDPIGRCWRALYELRRTEIQYLGDAYLWERADVLWVGEVSDQSLFAQAIFVSARWNVYRAETLAEACEFLGEDGPGCRIVIAAMGREGRPEDDMALLDWLEDERADVPCMVFTSLRAVEEHRAGAQMRGARVFTAGLLSLLSAVAQERAWC